jgi:hypothetical protein
MLRFNTLTEYLHLPRALHHEVLPETKLNSAAGTGKRFAYFLCVQIHKMFLSYKIRNILFTQQRVVLQRREKVINKFSY